MSLQCYPDIPPFSFVFDIFLHVPGRGEEGKQKHKVPSLKLPTPANSRFLFLIIKTPPPQKKKKKQSCICNLLLPLPSSLSFFDPLLHQASCLSNSGQIFTTIF
ncbi:hypothetical protein Dimus_002437 [Dionaea muscipula]